MIWIPLVHLRSLLGDYFDASQFFTLLIDVIMLMHFFVYMQKRKFKTFYLFIPLILSFLLCIFNFGFLVAFDIVLSVVSLKNISNKRIILVSFLSSFIVVFLCVAFLLLGIVPDETVNLSKNLQHIVGHKLGFHNTNVASMFFFNVILITSLFLLEFTKYKVFNYLLLFPCYVVFKLTGGRTTFYAEIVYFLCLFIFDFKFFLRHFRKLYVAIPFLFSFLIFVGLYVYTKYPIIDVVLSGRFYYYNLMFNDFSLKSLLIGIQINDNPMDCAYLNLFSGGGLVLVYVFSSIYVNGINKISPETIKKYMPLTICMLVSGLAENTFSAFSPVSIVFYKILADQFVFPNKIYVKAKKYLALRGRIQYAQS